MKLIRFGAALVAMSALVAADAYAQVGSILGKLVDEQGNPVAEAECTVELSGGGGRRSNFKSKDDGSFVKAGLRPGVYTIRCEKEGFRPLPLQTQVSSMGQGDLGTQVMFPLAEGELSEADHARATALLEDVQGAAAEGNNEETLQKLLELHEMMPTSTEIVFNIASTYESMEDYENATKYYSQAAEENPELAYDAYIAIGDMRYKERDWAGAADAMKKAMDIKQVDAVAMFNYAVYAQNAGLTEDAEAAFLKTVEIDPNQAIAYYQLGLISVGKMDNDAAIDYFEKFIALAPDHDRVDEAQGVIDALKAKEASEK